MGCFRTPKASVSYGDCSNMLLFMLYSIVLDVIRRVRQVGTAYEQ